ncbi:hypothetical protein ANCCEY_13530 [Ancylostoma ceylanicum]|uniref:RNA-directed DNA polymerase n=1 Tax=Ancylostoma ceylanicum TaxID=53326 RepID=A0A0D6LC27_9BILA|nr:hypothetical protein ANCCEY_13530 [Ancylostoma ceylanicum]
MAYQKVSILLSTPATEEVEVDFPIPVRVAETTNSLLPSGIDPSKAEVSEGERLQLLKLFEEFSDRISRDSYDLGSYEESEIVIKTTTEVPPTRFRPPRIPIKFQKELEEHINKLLRAGRIVESDTPWVHNTVLVTICGDHYSPAERNLRAIIEFPKPTTIKEVEGFVGMANFFRKFTANFSLIAAPLHSLLKDKAKFMWGQEQEEAFLRLEECLLSKPCLAFPRDEEFFLHTDGTQVAVGAALFQKQLAQEKPLVAVGYFSKALSDSQKKWSPKHVEFFAIISALLFFRATIYGNHTTIFSDHTPLTLLLKHNKTHDDLARWVVELQSYDVSIEYLKGPSNVVADALSRFVNKHDDAPESDDIVEFPVSINTCRPRMYSVRSPIVYAGCPVAIRPYEQKWSRKPTRTVSEEEKPALLALAEKCNTKANGCLYYRDPAQSSPALERSVVPEKLREPIFLAFHTSPSAGGHFIWRKTLAKIARRYFWPHMAEDVYAFVRSCEPCQRKRAQRMNREHLLPVASGAVFDKVYVDLTGPIHTSDSGNKYIIAMIDHFTKYVVAAPLLDCSAITVAQAVMTECILKFGVMTQLVSDNASYFKGERHIPSDDDAGIYVENLVSTLHAAWRAAAAFDQKQSPKFNTISHISTHYQ